MFRHSGKALALSFLFATVAAHSQTVTKQINFAQPTVGVAVNFFTNKVYVATPSYGGNIDYVTVIDGSTDTVTAKIGVARGAQLPVVDIVRNKIYVAGCDTYGPSFKCIVTELDGVTNNFLRKVTVTTTEGDGIIGIAFDPVYDKLYLANGSNNRIDVIDGEYLKVLPSISTNGQEPFGISINPLNQHLYVPYYTNQVQVFDTNKDQLIDTATFGTNDVATAVNWLTGHVFVSDNVFGPSTEGVLDMNGAVVASTSVSETPYSVDVDLASNKAFVLSTGIPALTEIDGSTNAVISSNKSINANYVAVNPVASKVYVSGNNGVTVLSE